MPLPYLQCAQFFTSAPHYTLYQRRIQSPARYYMQYINPAAGIKGVFKAPTERLYNACCWSQETAVSYTHMYSWCIKIQTREYIEEKRVVQRGVQNQSQRVRWYWPKAKSSTINKCALLGFISNYTIDTEAKHLSAAAKSNFALCSCFPTLREHTFHFLHCFFFINTMLVGKSTSL